MRDPKFDDLRPYYDEEIAPAMQRIAASEYFPLLAAYVYPDHDPEEVKRTICTYTAIEEFQLQVMRAVNERVIADSVGQFTFDGIDRLDAGQRYLFVSNHRDIMMDATLLQYALYLSGHRTSEISFGSNLMHPQLVVDIGKSNKMYKVIREGNMKDFYNNSLHLSEYIRYTLLEKRESVWIAQRNGRAKDGRDATETGIVRMFYMGRPDDPVKALAELNIVPVSISYQWESCDTLKALELYRTQRDGQYVKLPGEDLNSILFGIRQNKGDVHIHFGSPLTMNDLQAFSGLSNNVFNRQVAALMDRRIVDGYRLSCNNYIAHDRLSRTERYAQHYTLEQEELFNARYSSFLDEAEVEDKAVLGAIFLRIYANPVDAKKQFTPNLP